MVDMMPIVQQVSRYASLLAGLFCDIKINIDLNAKKWHTRFLMVIFQETL